MCARRSNAERSGATRDTLIEAARGLFAARGYAATTLVEIAGAAEVSTGALYHHWPGKTPLMGSVVEAIHQELAGRIIESARAEGVRGGDPLLSLESAAMIFLQASRDPAVGRILLVEAPSVLAERWHELDRRWWHAPTTRLLRRAQRTGVVDLANLDGYATALLGSLTALGRSVAAGALTPEEAAAVLHALLDGLRRERRLAVQ